MPRQCLTLARHDYLFVFRVLESLPSCLTPIPSFGNNKCREERGRRATTKHRELFDLQVRHVGKARNALYPTKLAAYARV